MPATYTIDSSRRLVSSKGSGVITAAELLDHMERLRIDPAFRPDFLQIFDFSDVTEVQVSAEDVRLLAAGDPWGAGARRAVVANRPVVYGLVRMYETLIEAHGEEMRLFDNLAEARRWLGLEP